MKTLFTTAIIAAISMTPAMADTSANSESGSYSQSAINNGGDSIRSSTVIAPSGNNTAPCVLHPSFGIGVAGVGVAGGSPYVDANCISKVDAAVLRDIARMNPQDPARRATIMHLCMNNETIADTMVALGWCVRVSPREYRRIQRGNNR